MNYLILGGTGGIGDAMIRRLLQSADNHITASWCHSEPALEEHRLRWIKADPTNEEEIEQLAQQCPDLDVLINTIGMLHNNLHGPEKTVRAATPEHFLESMRINALPTLLLAKHFRSRLKGSPHAVFATVSARVGSIGENHLGGWYSYRASKAALNQLLKTISIEWKRDLPNCCVASLHPGTTDTRLSKPFQARVPEKQLFSADYTADCLLGVIANLTPQETGRFWSFDGTELPW